MQLKRRTRFIRRRLATVSLKAVIRTAGALPFPIVRPTLSFLLGRLAPITLGRHAHTNLELAFGDSLPNGERRRIVRQVAGNLGNLAAEVLAMQRRRGAYFDDRIELGDYEDTVTRELARGRGLIHVTAHIGNWELGGHVTARLFPKHMRTVVGRKMANAEMDPLMVEHRLRSGLQTVDRDTPPRRLLRILRENQSFAIVPDQDIVDLKGIFIDFFGQPAYTPIGPAWLAYKSGAPILPTFLVREGSGFRMVTGAVIHPDPNATDRDIELRRLTEAWSAAVEDVIRAYPSQWMWFHRRWRTTPERIARRHPAWTIEAPRVGTAVSS